jgi:hypothetical protein
MDRSEWASESGPASRSLAAVTAEAPDAGQADRRPPLPLPNLDRPMAASMSGQDAECLVFGGSQRTVHHVSD